MELWVKIPKYRYKVSNKGRIKRMDKIVRLCDGRVFHYKERLLKPGISEDLGYPIVVLTRNKRKRTFLVHLLVAAAFLPPKPPRHEINHKNGIKSDCRSKNLEWKTHQANMIHSVQTGLRKIFVCGKGKGRYTKRNPIL